MILNEQRLLEELGSLEVDEHIYELDSDKKTVRINMNESSFYLASKYNPVNEGEKFADSKYNSSKHIVVYGLGFGHHIMSLAKKLLPNQVLHIVECNLNITKLCFENTEIKKCLQNEQVVFISGSRIEEILDYLKEVFKNKDLTVAIFEPSLRAMPDTPLKDLLETFLIKSKSIEYFSGIAAENYEFNIRQGYENGGRVFKNCFVNKPLIIVCAGPSLSQNVEELKKVGDRALILAVGHVAKYLYNAGVKADFYIDIESQDMFERNFSEIPCETPLFLLSTASKGLSAYNGKKYILFEEYSTDDEQKPFSVSVGGSVSTVALSLAILMGCSPVIFVGQDLSYWSEQTHVDEEKTFVKLKSGKTVEAIGGGTCYTAAKMYAVLKWIERYVKKFPDTEFINCTARGAMIDGFEHKSIREALDM